MSVCLMQKSKSDKRKKNGTSEGNHSPPAKKVKASPSSPQTNGKDHDEHDISAELSPEAMEGAFENFKISDLTISKLKGL